MLVASGLVGRLGVSRKDCPHLLAIPSKLSLSIQQSLSSLLSSRILPQMWPIMAHCAIIELFINTFLQTVFNCCSLSEQRQFRLL